MLELVGLKHTKFTTTSEHFMDDLFKDVETLPNKDPLVLQMLGFTDIVFIGGDGLSYQFYKNACISKYFSHFREIAFGYLPGGSWCGQACDLSGRIDNHACTNVLRGTTSKR